MSSKHRLEGIFRGYDAQKENRKNLIPGVLGVTISGEKLVDVPGRQGYVYVQLRDSLSELVQAYNDSVSQAYGMPVLVVRDDIYVNRYRVVERDLTRYNHWKSSYVPRHGQQHSFSGRPGDGGDVSWIYGRQFMPLAVHPSGTAGAENVVIEPYVYYYQNDWVYAGGTGTASIVDEKPITSGTAKMVLVYLDTDQNPALEVGDAFDHSITGTVEILPYIPGLPDTGAIPLAGVRLVSGTSTIRWENIYDLRPIIVGDGFLPTGSYAAHIIQDEGVGLTHRPALNFVGPLVWAVDNAGNNSSDVIISGSSGHTIQDERVNLSDRTNLNFAGLGVVAVDNPGQNASDIIISGSSTFATLAEAQAGVIESEMISPYTLPVWVLNDAFVRRDGYGGDPRGQYAVDLQRTRSLDSQVASGDNSFVGGGEDNTASGTYAVAVGGYLNTAGLYGAFVGGGEENKANGIDCFIGGGYDNEITEAFGDYAFIGGGDSNKALSTSSAVVAGSYNIIDTGDQNSFIGNGFLNYVSGSYSSILAGWKSHVNEDHAYAWGHRARVNHESSYVLADKQTDSDAFNYFSTGTNQYSSRFTGGHRFTSGIDGSGVPSPTGTVLFGRGGVWIGGNLDVDGKLSAEFLDLPEALPPGTPATNNLRLFNELIKGFSTLKYFDDGGMKREFMRDSVIVVKNVRGTTIAANRIVYATGSEDQVPTVNLAKSDSASTLPAIGVTIETIADGAYGRVMQIGVLENINTAALVEGDILYVSDSTAGVPQTTKPVTPSLTQEIGTVLVSDASSGAIQIVARGLTGDEYGTAQNIFYLGNGVTGSKTLSFNSLVDGTLVWDETQFIFDNILKTNAGRIVNTTRIDDGDSPYTVLAADHVIFCDTDGGAITLNLPAGVEGTYYRIINCGSSANDVTIDGNGAETVLGAATHALSDGETLVIVYNATEGWW